MSFLYTQTSRTWQFVLKLLRKWLNVWRENWSPGMVATENAFFTFWFRNSELEMIKNVRFRSQTDIDLAIWIIKNVTTVISLRFSNIPGKDFGKYKIETKAVEWCDLVVCGTNWVWRKRAIFTQGYSKLRLPDDIFYWDYIEFRIHARK